MESLKNTSRITTLIIAIIIGIITYISTMNPDNLATYLGIYGSYAPIIIIIAGIIVNQYSEESRVKRAEELVHHEYTVLGQPKEKTEKDINSQATTDQLGNPLKTDDTEINTTADEIPETELFITKTEKNEDDAGVKQ